ncbi:transglycosylase SLT domain-containing protein [Haliea sp. E17]|uniref:transglycosylase SLT domain-containing protein n=1 Tax=Haliea sp. E17 TaxID=3401576 RepID=UPI003AB028B1
MLKKLLSHARLIAPVVALFVACPVLGQALEGARLSQAREDYSAARKALVGSNPGDYQALRSRLDNYPLAVYLDYEQLSRRPGEVSPEEAARFIGDSADTPLSLRFLGNWLRQAGRERRWQDFLAVNAGEPNSLDLKCYYFRARLATGDPQAAWDGAAGLWVHGKSRPEECDPLFDAWMKAGQLNDELVWQRLLATFDAREGSLMRYVAGRGSASLQPWSERLLSVYAKPSRMRSVQLPPDEPRSADIVVHGLAYLARYNPAQALDYWLRYQEEMEFSGDQRHYAEHAIALRSMFAETAANTDWLQGALARLKDDELVEIRLRWAIGEQDWAVIRDTLPLLSEAGQGSATWGYWRARTLSQAGDDKTATELLRTLSGQREFHGFLAADRIGADYSYNDQPLAVAPGTLDQLRQLPAVQRIEELYYHQRERDAHAEWYMLLQETADTAQLQALTQLAFEEGWYRMAIDGASRASAWDALAVRFPTPYWDIFRKNAAAQGLQGTELMSIARRESAFFPEANSPAGAMGLMQIMPATGRHVAKQLKLPFQPADLYRVEYNVELGSAYYRELLDRFGGNRIFALAAYNAGPHRVDRWRNGRGEQVPVDIWVETIPYRETRNYVQAVLAYNVLFQHRLGERPSLLTETERSAFY